jgi:hypothetical protein
MSHRGLQITKHHAGLVAIDNVVSSEISNDRQNASELNVPQTAQEAVFNG